MSEITRIRYTFIDQVRGMAILLMIVFHLFYDLNIFKFVSIDFKNNYFWWGLPRIIVFLFLLAVGMSLRLNHFPSIKWANFRRRIGLITIYALIVSVTTYIVFPTRWIFFGTLHCIALCSLWGLGVVRHPKVCLAIAIGLIMPSTIFKLNIPWVTLKHLSMDYISPFPWFGVVCLGIYFTYSEWHKWEISNNRFLKYLEFLGKHPLKIYIAHQPILYGISYLLYEMTR